MSRIVVSRIHDPFINLALETTLFRSLATGEHLLFLYTNDPCIVIGRNQNPWKECNLAAAHSLNVPVIRRRSGGGTVVHDRGNVNFCIQGPKEEFHRQRHIEIIVEALRKRGAKLQTNERHDIVNERQEKVSGSSFKIERAKAYHHATMLLNADIDRLRALLLRPPSFGRITGRGTESVRSPVSNAGISHKLYEETWIESFASTYGKTAPIEIHPNDIGPDVMEDAQTLSSWRWTFGETPLFEHDIGPYKFTVDKGHIVKGPAPLVGSAYRNLDIEDDFLKAIDPASVRPSASSVASPHI